MIKSLEKALDIMRILGNAGNKGLTLEEITAQANLSRTTTWRLLATLREHDFVAYDSLTREFSLGSALLRIAQAAYVKFDLQERVKAYLRELTQLTGESANFAIPLDNGEMMFIEQVKSSYLVNATPQLGVRRPSHCTASGKAMLAFMAEEDLLRIVQERGLVPLTKNSITSLPELKKDLAKIRECGYAIENEETEAGGTCVGAAILDARCRPIAGISVTGPSERMGKATIEYIGSLVANAARKLSASAQ